MSSINKHSDCYNPENGLACMPKEYIGKFFNACTEPCDMLIGPCACGAWHHQEEWPDNIQLEVFGNISEKQTICKRRPIRGKITKDIKMKNWKIYKCKYDEMGMLHNEIDNPDKINEMDSYFIGESVEYRDRNISIVILEGQLKNLKLVIKLIKDKYEKEE